MFTVQYQLYLGHNNPVTGDNYSRVQVSEWCRVYITPAFPGFTLTEATGYWRGTHEESTIVTILGTVDDRDAVNRLAKWYKTSHQQEAVLVTTTNISGELV